MIVASALGDLGLERRAEIMPNGAGYERMIGSRIAYRQAAAARTAAEVTRRAALTPEQRAAEDAAKAARLEAARAQAAAAARFKAELWRSKPGPGHVAITPLSPEGLELQAATLARDWDRLFGLTGGVRNWVPARGQRQEPPSLGKYSFQILPNGRRKYIPFTEPELRAWVFSKHYRTHPTKACTDRRRMLGLEYALKKGAAYRRRTPNTSNPSHLWPIRPGKGHRKGHTYMCQPAKKSLWMKIRSKVYIAAGIVAAVFLGPIVISKVGGMLAHGQAGGAIVGAGAKAGTAAAITTKAGATALVAAKAGTAAAVVAKAGLAARAAGYFSTIQSGIGLLNNARTVNAIIQGDMPPPPIATGKNFTDWAMNIAKDEIAKTQAEKLSELDEARMRAELAVIQREIDALVPRGTPTAPDPNLSPGVRERIVEMQNIERQREGADVGMIALAVGVPLAVMALVA